MSGPPEAEPSAEHRLQLLIDSVRDYAIFMLDPEGRIKSWNRGAELIKGYTAQEIIGRTIHVFYTEEDLAASQPEQLLAEARERGPVEHEGWRLRKDGSRFWADVVISGIRSETGALLGFVKVTRDLTERRNAEMDRLQLRTPRRRCDSSAARPIRENASRSSIVRHRIRERFELLVGTGELPRLARDIADQLAKLGVVSVVTMSSWSATRALNTIAIGSIATPMYQRGRSCGSAGRRGSCRATA
jgi:PAS domain S-box-containing protein